MKKFFLALVALAMVPALYAADDTSYRNVCDSLSLGEQPVIELVPAYIEESNWYGNPHTWVKDSSNFRRHESYQTLSMNYSKNATMQIPVSITASCHEMQGTEVGFAKWTTSQVWEYTKGDDFYSTYIYDIHALKMDGHDSSNTYNILAFVPGTIPTDYSFQSNQLLFSSTFEFAFEWWFASASYQHHTDATHITNRFGSSAGNDSLKVVNAAISVVPDSIKNVRIQVLKVVLVDSRKLLGPESSSSAVASSSSVAASSSSAEPVSCSSAESSSSAAQSSSSKEPDVSSSSAAPESSSAESSSSIASSSSEANSSAAESSSSAANSSSAEASSSSEAASSSSVEPESSSAAESSSSDAESSSSEEESSSSEEGPTRLATVRVDSGSARFVQVRRLDGTVVKNNGKLAPGVYYVKDSRGLWKKMAVLPR